MKRHKPQAKEKYFQNAYLMKDQYPKCTKNS